MKSFVLISCIVLVSVSFCESYDIACPWNQFYNPCGTLCPLTCDNYNDSPGDCATVCNPGCQCYNGYVKNKDGDCVLPQQCQNNVPACPQNQYYAECGTACPLTCDNYNNPPDACPAVCKSGCQCYDGYVKNKDGDCVLPNQCPYNPPACPQNQYYNECGTACPLTCDNYNNPPDACGAVCKSGCQCYDGYIKNQNGDCVLPSQCPYNPPACPQNQYYAECGTACPLTCDNYNNPPDACPAVCKTGCQCYDGYVKNNDGECILPTQCPYNAPACPWNQYYNSCGTSCPLTCDNYNNPPAACSTVCNPSCQCYDGYIKNKDGDCVLPSQCPRKIPECSSDEYYESCASACPQTCNNYKNPPNYCSQQCQPGCTCNEGLVRNEYGKCVRIIECVNNPPACPPNQHYESCATSCPLTCDNYQNPPPFCTTKCQPGCTCNYGFVLNSRGECISAYQCPIKLPDQCGTNEEPSYCVSPCNNCKDRGYCGVYPCTIGCDCRHGYYRNERNQCIPESYCPVW